MTDKQPEQMCSKGGLHEWGTDGAHANRFCKKCFVDEPATPPVEPRIELPLVNVGFQGAEYGAREQRDADQKAKDIEGNALRAENKVLLSEIEGRGKTILIQLEEIERLKGLMLTTEQAEWLLNKVSWCDGCRRGKSIQPDCSAKKVCPLTGLADILYKIVYGICFSRPAIKGGK